MSGFIAVRRSLWDHPLFEDGPMTEREAWIWMIARAAWKDTKHRVGKAMIEVPRGSFMATLRELQKEFRWKSDTRVRNFLDTLEGESMIERKAMGFSNARKTQITICNFDDYQSGERTRNARETHEKRAKNAVKEQENNRTIDSPPTPSRRKPKWDQVGKPDDVSQQVWDDFIDLREVKRAPVSHTVVKATRDEAAKVGWRLERALIECVSSGWQGFKARYVENRNGHGTRAPPGQQSSTPFLDQMRRTEQAP